jgi:hypothetical protein
MKTTSIALALALAGMAGSAALVLAAAPAAAQPGTDTNGWNVRSVQVERASYVRQSDGTWAELDANGRVTFRFVEVQRDEWSVYLNDPSRNVQLQLDLFRRKVSYGTNGGPRSDLYAITSASRFGPQAQRPTPPPPPPPPAPRTRMVNAGPIWSQQDAQTKCPVAAYAVNGRWTGQWRTTREGQMSVCEIAY